jgi:hypothetical protein
MSLMNANLRPGALTQHKFDRTRTFWDKLLPLPLATTNNYTQEGDCMVMTSEAGVDSAVYARSAGTANEHFAGCAVSDYKRITDFVDTTSCVVPSVAAFTYQLPKSTPVAATFYLEDSAGTVMTDASPGAPASVNQYSVSTSGLVTFHAAKAGATISMIRYTYTPTVVESNARFYQRPLVAQGQTFLSQVDVMTGQCQIYTTQYNTANTYAVAARVYTGADGKFTTDATAVQVAGVVVSLPTTSDVYLGVQFNVVVPGALTF